VTLDLTGLPPTPEQVDAFVLDTRPDAYERFVDQLLESPRFGEHRARYWLDAVRYSDTHGLHIDNYRELWLYRQWIINAFNNNMPFDQFTIEQLAGDLLPNPTNDQLIASGFNRAHVTTSEGGVIREEVFIANVKDRVETTGTVFLGLAMGCAVCHDHKYDPITMRDFYSMSAFFNSCDDSPLDGNTHVYPPLIRVGTPEQNAKIAQLRQSIADKQKHVDAELATIQYTDPGPKATAPQPTPKNIVFVDDDATLGATLSGQWNWLSQDGQVKPFSGDRFTKSTHEELGQHFFSGAKDPLIVTEKDALFAYVYLDPKNPPKQIMLQWNDGSWDHRTYWGDNKINWGKENTPARFKAGPLPETGKWVRLAVEAKQVGFDKQASVRGIAFTQFGGTAYWDKAGLIRRGEKQYISFEAWVLDAKKLKDGLPSAVLAALKPRPQDRTETQTKTLRDYFLTHIYPETRDRFESLAGPIDNALRVIDNVEKEMPLSLISKETPEPRPAWILIRGQYDQHGDEVTRATPAFLPPMKPGLPKNRLGFAKWLVDRQHPLTARVAVNRFWEQLFGVGLVKTSEDFGSQGESPQNQELLDFLAVQFQDDGWDVKKFFRRMVLSATYRQSARVTRQLAERDPENRLLARGPRFRLDAEMLRDQALYISGLLVEKLGGPSVKVPQPAGLWEAVGYTSSNTAKFVADTGVEKVHRRSLYTFWKRTSAPPQMTTFDAPSREACVVRRERTNTPLQALLMMNETQYFEAARALAERTLREGGRSPEQRISWVFARATGRQPDAIETAELLKAYRDNTAVFSADPARAAKLINVGESKPDPSLPPAEVAAWTMISNIILNLDEVITKG
jgi:hypothetical protein